MMYTRFFAFCVLAVTFSALPSFAVPPTTKPAAAPRIGPATAPAAALADPAETLKQAREAFRVGDFKHAADLANQSQRDSLRQHAKPTDPAIIDAAHLEGVAFIKLGVLPKAADALQKTLSAMPGNRTLLFNIALCDVLQKSLAVRAAKSLQAYAATHSDDELIINLLGCAIDQVSSDGKNPAKAAELAAAYIKIDALLQATRPGMVRWGTQWLTSADFEPIAAKRNRQKVIVDDALRSRDRAVSALKSAEAAFARASAPIVGVGIRPRHEWSGDNCMICLERERRYRMDSAQREVDYRRPLADEAVTTYTRELADMPKPLWTMPMEPLDPFE